MEAILILNNDEFKRDHMVRQLPGLVMRIHFRIRIAFAKFLEVITSHRID
jgi:hypothetical protein